MAYEGNNARYGTQNNHPCNLKHDADAQNNLSVSTVISKSCVVLEGLRNITFPAAGLDCQDIAPRNSYPTHRNDSLSERGHPMNSDSIPPITDHPDNSGQSYGTLSIDSINTDVFFEMPSAVGLYAPSSLLTPSGQAELVKDYMDPSATCNDSSLEWDQDDVGDNIRQTEYTSTLSEVSREHAYKFKCLPNFDQSASFYGHAQSHTSVHGQAQSNTTFYGNAESYTPVCGTEMSNFCSRGNHVGGFGRKNSDRMDCYDRANPDIDHPSCLLQLGEAWRSDYSLQYTGCTTHSSDTGNRPGCDPAVFSYGKYYQDDPLFDSRLKPSNNISSDCLLASPNDSTSSLMTSDERFSQLDPTTNAPNFLMKVSETTSATYPLSERHSFDEAHENNRLCESIHSGERRAFHGEVNQSDDSTQMDTTRCRTNQADEESHDEKTSRKSSSKAKPKKSDSVESLQHQLEMMEEKRRMRTKTRSNGLRLQLAGSGEQRQESSEVSSIIDVDHMISSGVTVAGFKPRAIIRKRCKNNTPSEIKNLDYWHKRRKNNDSARKSRESKKEKEKHFYKRALELEYENVYLLECLNLAEAELASLGRQFVPPPFDQSNCFY